MIKSTGPAHSRAATALAANLDRMAYHPRTWAVLGAMADKDLAAVVAPLLPLRGRGYDRADIDSAIKAKAAITGLGISTAKPSPSTPLAISRDQAATSPSLTVTG